jgi:hypothetical protein
MRNWYGNFSKSSQSQIDNAQLEDENTSDQPVAPMVDMSAKPRRATQAEKKSWYQAIEQAIGSSNFFDQIPLGQMMEALRQFNVQVLQEDGTEWGGFLVGGAECGAPEASNQFAKLELARDGELVNAELYLTWCKMPRGKYEVVWYLT